MLNLLFQPSRHGCKLANSCLLPPRSMAGQLTLDQHIGVRIPGGQPKPKPIRIRPLFPFLQALAWVVVSGTAPQFWPLTGLRARSTTEIHTYPMLILLCRLSIHVAHAVHDLISTRFWRCD